MGNPKFPPPLPPKFPPQIAREALLSMHGFPVQPAPNPTAEEQLRRWEVKAAELIMENSRLESQVARLTRALEPFAGRQCTCYEEIVCEWCRASRALAEQGDEG